MTALLIFTEDQRRVSRETTLRLPARAKPEPGVSRMFHVKHRVHEFPIRACGRRQAAGGRDQGITGMPDESEDLIRQRGLRDCQVISPKLAPP